MEHFCEMKILPLLIHYSSLKHVIKTRPVESWINMVKQMIPYFKSDFMFLYKFWQVFKTCSLFEGYNVKWFQICNSGCLPNDCVIINNHILNRKY